MSESVILSSPILIILFGAALAVTLFEKWYRKSAFLEWTAAILAAGASAASLILGAGLRETAAAIVLLILINLAGLKEERT